MNVGWDRLQESRVKELVREEIIRIASNAGGHLKGHCPACGRTSLMTGAAGHITCGHPECPDPTALDRLLDDGETEHLMTVHRDGSFTLRHPLKERLDGALETCRVHETAADHSGRLPGPGCYRVRLSADYGRLSFEEQT